MKNFNGKAIYQPSGKAAEYAEWACNFYVGCSNGCEYCYCKKGILKGVMGQDRPQLKKCFKHQYHAFGIFTNELDKNIKELKEHGLFFSFTTDPLLPEEELLTWPALGYATHMGVPIKILTKCTHWVDDFLKIDFTGAKEKELYAFGFTFTGHDELEPDAATNQERIEAMKKLHEAGFKTFASIEPIIDFASSMDCIRATLGYCDLYKIGLLSGKVFDRFEACEFMWWLQDLKEKPKIYLKNSIVKVNGYTRSELGENFVDRDYNIFNPNTEAK